MPLRKNRPNGLWNPMPKTVKNQVPPIVIKGKFKGLKVKEPQMAWKGKKRKKKSEQNLEQRWTYIKRL